jgi:cytochrome c
MITRAVLMGAAMLTLGACGKTDETATSDAPGVTNAAETVVAVAAVSGEAIYAKCAACHDIKAGGANGIGPALHGVVGRAIGSAAGYTYSSALKSKGGNWDAAALDAYITAPAKYAPGTKMAFAGLSKPEERKAVIEYMAAQK